MVTILIMSLPVPALHIVFGPDLVSAEVGVGVIVLCVHNVSCTGVWIFLKLARIRHWKNF